MEIAMVTEVKQIEEVAPAENLLGKYPTPEHLAQFPDFIPGKRIREPLDFEPIQLPPGSPSAAELIINDRGER